MKHRTAGFPAVPFFAESLLWSLILFGHAVYLFQSRDLIESLQNAVLHHAHHALFHGDALHVIFRDLSRKDDLLDLLGHDHDLVDAHASFVAEVAAGLAAFALVELHAVDVDRIAGLRVHVRQDLLGTLEILGRRRVLDDAILADAADEALADD